MIPWMMMILLYIFGLILFIIIFLVIYARWHYGTLEKLGFPVIPPHLFLGSSPDGYKKLSHIEDEERAKKYGPIYGAYEGRHPKIFINDPDLVKQMLVKDCDYFSDRIPWELLEHDIPHEFLDFQPGNKWRIMRTMITPALSLGRVKNMGQISKPIIAEYTQDLINSMTTQRISGFDVRGFTTPLIIELCNLLFLGIRLGDAKDPNNEFIKLIRSFFVDSVTEPPNFGQTLGYSFPFLGKLVSPGPFGIPFFAKDDLDKFAAQVLAVIKTQKERNLSNNDTITVILQMMERVKTKECKDLGITVTSVLAQILELYMAAYEGYPTAIATFLYNISKTQHAQQKLLAEIDNVLMKCNGSSPSREDIVDLPYLTACLTETFRIFPTFHRLDRVCVQDWECKERGIKIKKGIPIFVTLWPIHHNPEYFPNPKSFEPERFLSTQRDKLHPYAFGIFGHGPRSCPGNRLITDLLKIQLFEILTHVRIEPTLDFQIKYFPGFGPFIRTNPLLVDMIKRNVPTRTTA